MLYPAELPGRVGILSEIIFPRLLRLSSRILTAIADVEARTDFLQIAGTGQSEDKIG